LLRELPKTSSFVLDLPAPSIFWVLFVDFEFTDLQLAVVSDFF
jgi:hypothetical protein